MKIKKLKLQNFAKFTNFECEFDGKVTHLVGINGSGKTIIGLTALWACLKGISEKTKNGQLVGERFRFIGDAKATADIELTLFDEKQNIEVIITNHISKQSNQITFKSNIPDKINNEWLNNLLSVAFLSAKNFTSLNGKEQAILLGIDTEKYDKNILELKNEFTLLNRDYRNFGEIKEIEKVDKISISELINQKEKIDIYNRKQDDLLTNRDTLNSLLLKAKKEIENTENTLKGLLEDKKEIENDLMILPQIEDKKSTIEITEKINNVEQINSAADLFVSMKNQKKLKQEKGLQLDANKEQQNKAEKERLDFIKSFKFEFDTLSVDEDGKLLLDDRPIKEPYFSKGELEIIVAKLYASQNPELKIRFIDDFELLDEGNQKKILESLLASNFQIITAEVGENTNQENTILLRECKEIKGVI